MTGRGLGDDEALRWSMAAYITTGLAGAGLIAAMALLWIGNDHLAVVGAVGSFLIVSIPTSVAARAGLPSLSDFDDPLERERSVNLGQYAALMFVMIGYLVKTSPVDNGAPIVFTRSALLATLFIGIGLMNVVPRVRRLWKGPPPAVLRAHP
jgi:hypothetical protein